MIASQIQHFKSILLSKTAKDSLVIIAGDLTVAAIGFLISVTVIRVLGPTAYGSLALSIAVMAATVQILDLGIRTSAVRYISLYLKTDIDKAQIMLSLVFGLRLITGLTVFGTGFVLAEPLAIIFFNKPGLINLLRLAFVGVLGSLLYDFILTDLQAQQWFKKLASLTVTLTLTKALIIISLVLLNTVNLLNVMTVYIFIPFLGFLMGCLLIRWDFIKAKGNHRESFDVLFKFSKWIMISYILAAMYNRAEIFLLGHFKEIASVGIYAAAHTLTLPITLVCSSLTKTLLPKVTGLDAISKLNEYFYMAAKMLILLGILILPYYFLAPYMVLLIGNKYTSSIPIFRILFFHALIMGLVGPIVIIFYSLNKPHIMTYINCLQFCLTFSVNYLVIPVFGALGAAVVALCSHGLAALIAVGLVFKYLKAGKVVN